MESIKITFKNRHGHPLSGYLDLPEDKTPEVYGIFTHCFTCHKQYKLITNINEILIHAGIGILRFDFTGLGESKGDFSATSFSTNVSDIWDAAQYLIDKDKKPSFIIGHSLGGTAGIKASLNMDFIKAVITIGSPYTLTNLRNLLEGHAEDLETKGTATLTIANRQFQIRKDFLTNLDEQDIPKDIKSLKIPLLVIQATGDKIVTPDQGESLFNIAPQPKSFLAIDHANHLLSHNKDAFYAGTIASKWLKRHL